MNSFLGNVDARSTCRRGCATFIFEPLHEIQNRKCNGGNQLNGEHSNPISRTKDEKIVSAHSSAAGSFHKPFPVRTPERYFRLEYVVTLRKWLTVFLMVRLVRDRKCIKTKNVFRIETVDRFPITSAAPLWLPYRIEAPTLLELLALEFVADLSPELSISFEEYGSDLDGTESLQSSTEVSHF